MAEIRSGALERLIIFQDGQELCDYCHFLFTNGLLYDVLENIPLKDGRQQVLIREERSGLKYLGYQHL